MTIKALVVDNNPVLLRAVSAILTQEGCQVESAGTGLAALEALEDFHPDIVFTDLIMPLVSGEQLCRVLRNTEKYKDIYIVVLSAIVLEDRDRILKEIDCDLCIAKGDLKEIRQHLKDSLQSYRSHKIQVNDQPRSTRIPTGLKPSDVTGELLLEKRHTATILANLEEGILELSNQGKVVTLNRAALNILGKPEQDIIGCSFTEMVDWGELKVPVEMWTNAQLVKEGMRSFTIGEDTPLQVNSRIILATFTPVREKDTVFGLCIFRDITRQFMAEKYKREIDDAIKLVKKMDAMSCMAGGVAHDFNNLLTVICGNLDIVTLFADRQNYEDRTKLLEQARKAAFAAVDLTRQISGFSNFGIVSRESIDFGELIIKAVNEFFDNDPSCAQISVHAEIGDVYVDEEQIIQAVANVLQNAVEASQEPRLEIVIDKTVFTKPQLMSGQYVPAGQYARVDFKDSGHGIDQEKLVRIFDPYYSTKERGALKGMGLGLAIVYSTMRNHGGHVIVSSERGGGTSVSFFLPILQKNPSQNNLGGEEQQKHIVILEPDIPMQEIAKVMLTHLGYTVSTESKSGDLLLTLTQILNKDRSANEIIVLMEISEMNIETAVELCNSVKALDPSMKIVAMSGTIIGPVMENCQKFGFAAALSKPYTMDSLKHVISSVV